MSNEQATDEAITMMSRSERREVLAKLAGIDGGVTFCRKFRSADDLERVACTATGIGDAITEPCDDGSVLNWDAGSFHARDPGNAAKQFDAWPSDIGLTHLAHLAEIAELAEPEGDDPGEGGKAIEPLVKSAGRAMLTKLGDVTDGVVHLRLTDDPSDCKQRLCTALGRGSGWLKPSDGTSQVLARGYWPGDPGERARPGDCWPSAKGLQVLSNSEGMADVVADGTIIGHDGVTDIDEPVTNEEWEADKVAAANYTEIIEHLHKLLKLGRPIERMTHAGWLETLTVVVHDANRVQEVEQVLDEISDAMGAADGGRAIDEIIRETKAEHERDKAALEEIRSALRVGGWQDDGEHGTEAECISEIIDQRQEADHNNEADAIANGRAIHDAAQTIDKLQRLLDAAQQSIRLMARHQFNSSAALVAAGNVLLQQADQ